MSEQRPSPVLTEPDTQAFWQATQEQRFVLQQCNACENVIWHPRHHCGQCGSTELSEQVAVGTGRVYSFSVVRQSYHPFFRNRVPYVVAWVDLDEGIRFLTNIVNCEPERVSSDMAVQLCWEEGDGVSYPLVEPIVS